MDIILCLLIFVVLSVLHRFFFVGDIFLFFFFRTNTSFSLIFSLSCLLVLLMIGV